jgi:hypothetical protein
MMDLVCYIRDKGKNWIMGEVYHKNAFHTYLSLKKYNLYHSMDPVTICTQRMDGSIYMVEFYESKGRFEFIEMNNEDKVKEIMMSPLLPISKII